MPDPFIVPEEPSAAEAIAAIGDELDVFDDWMDRYQFIIELGRKLPPFPRDLAGRRASRAGLPEQGVDGGGAARGEAVSGRHVGRGDRVRPDRAAAAGLFGPGTAEIVATDPVFLKDLGLLEALSTNRGNGIAAMARKIRELAALQPAA